MKMDNSNHDQLSHEVLDQLCRPMPRSLFLFRPSLSLSVVINAPFHKSSSFLPFLAVGMRRSMRGSKTGPVQTWARYSVKIKGIPYNKE